MVPEAKLPPVILTFPLLIYPEDVLVVASLLEATANPFPVVDFISLPVLIVTISFDKPTLWNAIANVEGAEGRHAFVPNFSDDIAGQLMGKPIKQEDAIGKDVVLILAPSEFIYNVVQDIMIERDKDIKRHVNIISGYARAEGALSNDLAAVVLTVGSAG